MRYLLCLFATSVFITQCFAVDTYTKAIVAALQKQLSIPTLNDYFKRIGSLDPSLTTALMYAPNANVDGLLCLVYNFKEAVGIIRNNLGDVFSVVTYYQGKCKTDPNLNKALAALADKTAQQRLKVVAQNIINGLPKQVASLATDALNQFFSNNDITVSHAKQFATRIKKLNADTKQTVIAKLPSTKSFFNAKGAYNAPYTVLLNNFPILLTNTVPTAAQKTKVNNAIAKAFDYAHKNAVEYLDFVFGWLKSLPISSSVSSNLITTGAFTSASSKIVAAAKVALNLPPTQQAIENLFTDPYQL